MMSSARYCEKCILPINVNVDSYTVCEGICAKSFHATCVGLSEADLCLLSGNILWMCDGCVSKFHRYREKNFANAATNTPMRMTVEDELNDLKSTVASIVDTLAKIIPKVVPISTHSSTPISSAKLLNGTDEIFNNTCEDQRTHISPHIEEREERKNFSLYLTRIDRCATENAENDISRMVSRSLAVPLSDCKKVVKLVPKWKDTTTLDYVSFKIVLDEKWKSIAMIPATWPKEVKFREFVNQSNEIWRPN